MSTSPPVESPSEPRDNPCFGSDAKVAVLNVMADDGTSYLLPYAQFLCAERIVNPALEQKPDAPPEKLLIYFVAAEVVLLGSGLAAVERPLGRYELKFVRSADRRSADTLKAHITSVTLTKAKYES